MVGLGSMLGAGVFAALGPAAAAAGSGLLAALGLAAGVAYANATSAAQLAAVHPESGGAYVYGRRRLGSFWGFLAGWAFVTGKLASCAAAALTFAVYAVPALARPLAAVAVVAVTAVDYRGIAKTAALTRVLVALVLAVLALVVAAALTADRLDAGRLVPPADPAAAGGVLTAAGLLFFAFAGYARIATLGEEVTDPARTIPRAIPLALGIALLVYGAVAASALAATGPAGLAGAQTPLLPAVTAGRLGWVAPLVRVGAAVASLSILLSLVAAVSRTVFAMAANADLPRWLAAVHPRFKVPRHALLATGGLAAAAVLAADLRDAIGFSSVTVLCYYAVGNLAAWTLPPAQRRWPRWLAAGGLAGCLVLAASLPRSSVAAGGLVLAVGAGGYLARTARARRRAG